MIPYPTDAWPTVCEGADEWGAEEWLRDPGSHENYALMGGRLDEHTHDELDAAWLDAYFDVLRGDRTFDDSELADLGRRLRLSGPRTFDRRPPQVAPFPISDSLLGDIVEDTLPEAGVLIDRFLGPWMDEAPARDVARAAAVHLAWLPILDMNGTPAMRYYNQVPKNPVPTRRAVQAVHKAPPMLWTPDWKPLLPVLDWWIPDGPVGGVVVPLGGPVRAILARVTPTASGWHANGALGLPEQPPADLLLRRLDLELARRRRHERRTTWEVLLRLRPEVVFRFCTTWCWRRLD